MVSRERRKSSLGQAKFSNVFNCFISFQFVSIFFSDPKTIAYIQETVGETSSQSVVVAVDR